MKSLAIARQLVYEENLDFTVSPIVEDFVITDYDQNMEMLVSLVADNWVRDADTRQELIVSGESLPSKVAGSIAHHMRASSDVSCLAMGPSSVFRCARSIFLAQQYLDQDDPPDCELAFTPSFMSNRDRISQLNIKIFKMFRTCTITAEADIHKTAGYIAAGVRNERPPFVVGYDAAMVGQAVKTLAIVRTYLEKEWLDIMLQPEAIGEDIDDESTRLAILPCRRSSIRKEIEAAQGSQLYVSTESDPGKVAGAIANAVRKQTGVFCSAVGPYAVSVAIQSIMLARRYLTNDVAALYFTPQFQQDNKGLTSISLFVFPER